MSVGIAAERGRRQLISYSTVGTSADSDSSYGGSSGGSLSRLAFFSPPCVEGELCSRFYGKHSFPFVNYNEQAVHGQQVE